MLEVFSSSGVNGWGGPGGDKSRIEVDAVGLQKLLSCIALVLKGGATGCLSRHSATTRALQFNGWQVEAKEGQST